MQTRNILQAASGRQPAPFRIGPDHGYAFNGDQVRLDVELLTEGAAATADAAWALQLWACETPFDGQPVRGTKVAEVPVGAGAARVSALASAFPPAGHAAHAMVLVLATGPDGRCEQVCDYANFPRPERFAQPRLDGTTGFDFAEGRVRLRIDGVANPRAADNLSGTLAAELWALPAPFGEAGSSGGIFLAGVNLGSLAGQQGWHDLAFELPFGTPPAGTWHIALLLREWTATGYVTRDFTDFALPVTWAAPEAPTPAPAVPEPVPLAAADTPPVAAADTPPLAAAETPPAADAAPLAAHAHAPRKVPARVAKRRAAALAAPTGVSVNRASEAELCTVKGMPKAVAAAIVANRPYGSLNELLALKGIGVKLLDRLRASLKL